MIIKLQRRNSETSSPWSRGLSPVPARGGGRAHEDFLPARGPCALWRQHCPGRPGPRVSHSHPAQPRQPATRLVTQNYGEQIHLVTQQLLKCKSQEKFKAPAPCPPASSALVTSPREHGSPPGPDSAASPQVLTAGLPTHVAHPSEASPTEGRLAHARGRNPHPRSPTSQHQHPLTPTGQGPSVPLSGFWKCTKWSLWLCSTADRDRRLFSTELSLKSRRHQHPAPVTSLEARSHGPRHTSSRTIAGPCDQVSRRHPRAHHLRARPGQHPSIPDSRQAHISNNRLPNELGKASSVNWAFSVHLNWFYSNVYKEHRTFNFFED